MSVFGLVYLSRASIDFSSQQLQELVKKSQQHNQKLEITGMLLMSDGYFFQLLEGEEEFVSRLFNVISEDKRHQDVHVLFSGNLVKRYCPNWSMMLLVNEAITPEQTQDKVNGLLSLASQNYQHKDQLVSDLFCRFMTVRQLEEFKENSKTV